MKLFKSRKLSILLALTLVLTSLSFTAMAADGDVVVKTMDYLTSDDGELKNISSVSVENRISPAYVYDEVLEHDVLQYATSYYGPSSGSYNTAGSEARHLLISNSGGQLVDGSKKYLRIETDIRIANSQDGIGFRMGRYGADGNLLLAGDKASDNIFFIGGTDSTVSSTSHGFRFYSKTLEVGKWHHVVMELGTATDVDTVKFYVDGQQVKVSAATQGNEQVTEGDTITNHPTVDTDGTAHYVRAGYGFGGASGSRCAMLPTSERGTVLDTRLNGFTMTSTDTPYDPSTFVEGDRKVLYALHSGSKFSQQSKGTSVAAFTDFTVPDFGSYKKPTIVKITNPGGANINAAPGSDARFGMFTPSESTPFIDHSKYGVLRINFNVYIKEATSSVYFRTLRTTDGTFKKQYHNYTFSVSGADSINPSFSGDAVGGEKIAYKELSVGEWHNVVMELGTGNVNGIDDKIKNYNDQVKIYVDGQLVVDTSFGELEKDEEAKSYGFGSYSGSFCIIGMKNANKAPMEVYLSDLTAIACDSYNNSAVPSPSIDGVPNGGLTYRVDTDAKKITYVDGRDEDGMSLADFKTSNVDYFAPTDSTNTKFIAYNVGSKRVTYYTLAEQTDVVLNGVQAEIGEDGRLYVKFDYNKEESFKLHIAYYKNNALKHLKADKWCTMPAGLSAATYDFNLPTTVDYDEIRVFAWRSSGTGTPIIIPVLKSAEIDVVE